MRPCLVVGNWKMNKTIEEAVHYVQALLPLLSGSSIEPWLAVPFTCIQPVAEAAKDSSLRIGAQNMNDATHGAFTGEIAAKMLLNAGAQFVILGHSERRMLYKEDDAFINRKVHRALQDQLRPLLCIGEKREEREQGRTHEVLQAQMTKGLEGIKKEQASQIVIAYEPVWAIGSLEPATPDLANETHRMCRQWLKELFGEEIAQQMSLIYGGSVNEDNAPALLSQPEIDGLLVGGASLTPATFSQIIHSQINKVPTP